MDLNFTVDFINNALISIIELISLCTSLIYNACQFTVNGTDALVTPRPQRRLFSNIGEQKLYIYEKVGFDNIYKKIKECVL